ncbi:putative zinc finger, CCHC-type, retrotransposon gag domain protein [Tanacetum coccineum]
MTGVGRNTNWEFTGCDRNHGHYRINSPELKNRNHGNQARGTEARGMVYALGRGETDQDLENMEDDINA